MLFLRPNCSALRHFTAAACCLIALSVMSVHHAFATDLTVTTLVAPNPVAVNGTATTIRFVVANQNVLAATAYTIKVVVRNSANAPVYSETVPGKNIAAFTTLEHATSTAWTPAEFGAHTIAFDIDFTQDVDTTNDKRTFEVNVIPPSLSVRGFIQTNALIEPRQPQPMIEYTTDISTEWRYLNISCMANNAMQWVLRNMPIPPKDEYYSYWAALDLQLQNDSAITLPLIPKVTTQPLTIMPQDTLTVVHVPFQPLTVNIGGKGMRDTMNHVLTYVPITPTTAHTAPLTEAAVPGCDIPNLDLDSSQYNSTTVPGYAGDKNACAPTACANSMQWLEKHFPFNSLLFHREKLVELSRIMKRAKEEGVWSEDFVRAKLAYINKYNLPVKVKFQIRGLTKDIESPPEDDYESKASNQIEGAYPKWEWIKKEMHDSEDVECFLEYHDRSGDSTIIVGRHVVTASGVAESAGQHRFWYKDDADQLHVGGTRETAGEWRLRGGTVPIIDYTEYSATKSRTTVVYGVVSESYDSTVKRKEKSYWKKFKDRQLGWAPRYEHGNPVDWVKEHPLRFGNMYTRLRDGVYQPNEWRWVVRNHPTGDVFGSGTSTIINHNTLGIDTTRFPDPMEVRVIYTDEPVTTPPQSPGPGFLYPIPPSQGAYIGGEPNTGVEAIPTTHNSVRFPEPDGQPYRVDTAIVHTDVPPEHISADGTPQDSAAMVGQSMYTYAAAALKWLDAHVPEFNLEQGVAELRQCFKDGYDEDVSSFPVDVYSALRGIVSCGWFEGSHNGTYKPFDISFQSIRLQESVLPRATLPEQNPVVAYNASVNKRIQWEWLRDRLKRFGPMPICIGYYNAERRTDGTWALLTGIVEHNGLRRVILHVDMEEDRPTGQEKLVHTIQENDGYLYLVEQSSDDQRAYIETALSFEYDPNPLDVKDQPLTDIYAVTLAPHPVDEDLTLTWQQAHSVGAIIRIVDMLGVECVREVVAHDGSAVWSTSTKQLPNGRYNIVISTSAGSTHIPLVVVHE